MEFKKRIDKPLGQILINRGLINKGQLDKALQIQKKEGGLIGEIIARLGFAKEEDITHCLSLQFGFPYLPLGNYEVAPEIVALVPRALCTEHCLIPLDKIENTLTVAMANPLYVEAIKKLEEVTSLQIQVFISTPADVRMAIERYYGK